VLKQVPDAFYVGFGRDRLLPMVVVVVDRDSGDGDSGDVDGGDRDGSDRDGSDRDDENDEKR
jgi:hypothetical protein